MLVPNQKIETTWMPANVEHYISKGYKFDKIRQKLVVNVEDLSDGSHMKVKVVCDYCGKAIEKEYHRYLKEHEDGKDCCKTCYSKKFKESFQEKYGVPNPFQLESVIEKSKSTCMERYGVKNVAQVDSVKEKIAQTNLDKYGYVCTLQNDEIKKKSQESCVERYGVSNVFASDKIKKKIAETNMKKYGDPVISRSTQVKEKMKATCLERYGVEYSCQSPEIIAKMRKSLYENGNVPTSKPEKAMCEMLHDIFGKDKCKDNFALDRLNMDCLVDFNGVLIDFEYDGLYWHKDREDYDRRRNYYLMNRGYRVVRITGNKYDDIPTREQILSAVDYLVKDNHHLTYIDMNI